MKLQDAINITRELRPGVSISDTMIEMWIKELDYNIQTEIIHKKPSSVIKLEYPLWDENKKYEIGDKVGLKVSGKWENFICVGDVKAGTYPQDSDGFKKIDVCTYVSFPYDKIYYLYTIAMIDFVNQDFDKYANDLEVFNYAYEEFHKYWQRKYRYGSDENEDKYYFETRSSETV